MLREHINITTLTKLENWHKELYNHFKLLESKRHKDIPIFAIEHELDLQQLESLKQDIEEILKTGIFYNEGLYMPWVVYATERGYEYSGDEYWQTFNEKTSNWIDSNHNRNFIKNCFLRFEQDFRTVKPTGDWATHFNIISRPIINSILPKDIQFSLLKVLFDIRFSITKVHLEDIILLGKKIQDNSWSSTSRFQTFAQNAALLGQFTKALLDSTSNVNDLLISEKTFSRIEEDLSHEEKDKIFLNKIRERIIPLKFEGIRTKPYTGRRESIEDFYRGSNKILSAKPSLYLSPCEDNSWNIILHIPVMTFILQWSEKFVKILNEGRVKITSSTRSNPFPARNLLYRDNEFTLLKWPTAVNPLIEFTLGNEVKYEISLNNIYDHTELLCFYLNAQNKGIYVSHTMLESDKFYIFIYTNPEIDEFLKNCEEIKLNCAGIKARIVETNKVQNSQLKELGFNILRNITLKPIAYPATNNDYIGVYEYSSQENPTFLITSNSRINKLKLELWDDNILNSIELVDINPKEKRVLQMSSLKIGNYSLKIEAEIFNEDTILHTNGLIEIYVRDENNSSVRVQTPLQLYISPSSPSLEDFWEMKYKIKILGPIHFDITPEVTLLDNAKKILYHNKFNKIPLPVETKNWNNFFLNFKKNNKNIGQNYEDSYSTVLTFSEKNLGYVSHSFERRFMPLRWIIRQNKDKYKLKLISGAGIYEKININKFNYNSPNKKQKLNIDQFIDFNSTDQIGGLYLAECEGIEAGFIVPPSNAKSLQDLSITFDELKLVKSNADIVNLINNIYYWSTARQSGNQLALLKQQTVYSYLSENLFRTICGNKWVDVEKLILDSSPIQYIKYKLIPLLQNQSIERYLYNKFDTSFDDFMESDLIYKIEFLENIFTSIYYFREYKYFRQMYERYTIRVASDFILRFANSPQNIMQFDPELINVGIKCILEHPILLRIARILVIYFRKYHQISEDNFYWGWEWDI